MPNLRGLNCPKGSGWRERCSSSKKLTFHTPPKSRLREEAEWSQHLAVDFPEPTDAAGQYARTSDFPRLTSLAWETTFRLVDLQFDVVRSLDPVDFVDSEGREFPGKDQEPTPGDDVLEEAVAEEDEPFRTAADTANVGKAVEQEMIPLLAMNNPSTIPGQKPIMAGGGGPGPRNIPRFSDSLSAKVRDVFRTIFRRNSARKLSQRAATREAKRQAGIPTSQQPVSQTSQRAADGTKVGRQQTFETPKPGGGTQTKSVQISRDRVGTHAGQPQVEAGNVKPGGQVDRAGRPRIQNPEKVRVDFDPDL